MRGQADGDAILLDKRHFVSFLKDFSNHISKANGKKQKIDGLFTMKRVVLAKKGQRFVSFWEGIPLNNNNKRQQ